MSEQVSRQTSAPAKLPGDTAKALQAALASEQVAKGIGMSFEWLWPGGVTRRPAAALTGRPHA